MVTAYSAAYVQARTAEIKQQVIAFACTTANKLNDAWQATKQAVESVPWGTVGKVALMVGGAALTIATLGAAGPVVGAIMIAGLVASTAMDINDMVADATGTNFIKDKLLGGNEALYAGLEIGVAVVGLIGPNGAGNAAKLASKADDVADVVSVIKNGSKAADTVSTITISNKLDDLPIPSQFEGEISATLSGRIKVNAEFGDTAIRNASRAPREEGFFDVIAHGTPTSIADMPASEVADIIRETPSWQGQPVRLLSCSTACPIDGGPPVAQQLADDLGVSVKAPTTEIIVSSRGTMSLEDGGEWVVFTPGDGKK